MESAGGGQAVAALIDAERKARGWSDARVAREAGVHHNTLGNWRAGKGISLAALSRVADVLDLSLTSLCDAYQGRSGHPDEAPPSEGVAAVLERLEGELLALSAKLDVLAAALAAAPSPDGSKR
jgi:transcriptional regulator with XRE-family HTH domain